MGSDLIDLYHSLYHIIIIKVGHSIEKFNPAAESFAVGGGKRNDNNMQAISEASNAKQIKSNQTKPNLSINQGPG